MIKNTLLLFLLAASFLSAQMRSQIGWMSKFGVAAGVNASWVFPNFDEINTQLPSFGISETFDAPILTWGGGGYIYLMIVDNVRVGGMGFGGSQSLSAVVDGFNREAKFSIGGGAFSVEYTLPFVKKIGVSVGAMIGGGSISLELYQNQGDFTWQNTWDEFKTKGGSENISRIMVDNYFAFTPTVNVDIPLTRFFAVRVGTGYQLSMNENWTIDNEKALSNVPSSLNGDGFFIQTGIYLGFFAY